MLIDKKKLSLHFSTQVRLGEHSLSKDPDCDRDRGVCAPVPQDFGVEEIIPHPNYSSPNPFQNDVALVRLDREAEVDFEFVAPICLPFTDDEEEEYTDTRQGIIPNPPYIKSSFLNLKSQD